MREELFFCSWGKTGPRDREAGSWPKTQKSNTKFSYALQAKAISAFRPNREKDELTYAIGTAEHSGRTRGLGKNISWEHGFPNDRDTYRSR